MGKTTMSVYADISAEIPLAWKVGFLSVLAIMCLVLVTFGFHPLAIFSGLVTLFLAVWATMFFIAKFVFSGVEAMEEPFQAGKCCLKCSKGLLRIEYTDDNFTESCLECSNCQERFF